MDTKRLFADRTYADATLVAEGQHIKVHKCVLDIVPFFEAAFRSGAMMKEGQNGTTIINVTTPYASLNTFLEYVYGLYADDHIDKRVGVLLQLARDCEMYEYKPFIVAVWESILNSDENANDAPSNEERAQCIEFAASHKPPISLQARDCKVTPISYEAASYLIYNDGFEADPGHRQAALELQFVVMWSLNNPVLLKKCENLGALCHTDTPLYDKDRTQLAELAEKHELNIAAMRLIIRTLLTPGIMDKPAVAPPKPSAPNWDSAPGHYKPSMPKTPACKAAKAY